MKKITKSFFAIVLVAVMLCSCSTVPDVKKEDTPPVTVTVWSYYNGTAKDEFDNLVTEFNKTVGSEKNIVVDAYSQGDVTELADAVLAAANADIGSELMPDIFAAYPDSTFTIDKLGKVASLNDYFTEEELDLYVDDFLADGYLDDSKELKILPIAKSSENIFINTTDFNKFISDTNHDKSAITTWEGLAKTAASYYEWTDKQTDALNDGKALFGMDSMANFMLVSAKQLGCDIYSVSGEEKEMNFPVEVARKIWDNFYIPFINGHYAAIGRFRSDDAKTGGVLAYSGSTAGAVYFPQKIEISKDSSYDIECGISPYPYYEGFDKVAVQQGAGMVIAKGEKKQEAASAEFLKWFTKMDNNLKFSIGTGYLPVTKSAMDFNLFKEKFIEMNPGDEASSTLISAEITYNMLEEFSLYSNKPFENSFNSRKVLENSLLAYAKADLESINELLAVDESKEKAIAQYATDENFNKWYTGFTAEMLASIVK